MKEILDCPFCGGKAFEKEIIADSEDGEKKLFMVGCNNNLCWKPTILGITRKDALFFWNKRHNTYDIILN